MNKTMIKTKQKAPRRLTALQKDAIEIYLNSMGKKSLTKSMLLAGYSESSAKNPAQLRRSPAVKEIIEAIPFEPIIGRQVEIALDIDKRAATSAAELLLKLGDHFPAGKLKFQAWSEAVERVAE